MIEQVGHPARSLTAGFAVVTIGVLVGVLTLLSLTLVRPVLLAFALGGLILLIPPLVLQDRRAYWLFLLVLTIPFDISKRTTAWLVQPWDLYREYGMPASGTLSLDFYLTDVVLFVLLAPWFARLCLRRDRLYFPKVAYIFVLYLAWALIVSLLEAPSRYLSIVEWCRQLLYFAAFLYIINNVATRSQFLAVVIALFIGLTIASGSVIAFFTFNIGTETSALSGLYREQEESSKLSEGTLYQGGQSATGEVGQTKRSAGIFAHPAHAAYYLEYILPIVLAYLLLAQRIRDRLFFGALFGIGLVALYMTFARAAVVGLFCSLVVEIAIARWSELISRRTFAQCVLVSILAVALSVPLLIHHLTSRPETISKRLELNEIALATFWKRPILGAGLNNSSIVTEGAKSIVTTPQGRESIVTVVHNYYLIVLIDVGLVGFLLYFTFFWRTVAIALRHMRVAETEMKLLLIGITGSLVGIAVNSFAEPFGGHVVHAMLWLHAGLTIAICRQVDLTSRRYPAPAKAAAEKWAVFRPNPVLDFSEIAAMTLDRLDPKSS